MPGTAPQARSRLPRTSHARAASSLSPTSPPSISTTSSTTGRSTNQSGRHLARR